MAVSGVFAFAYWFWIEVCHARNGFYPYPLFEILSPGQRVGLFGGSALVMTASTVVLKWVYGRVNGVGGKGPVEEGQRPGLVNGSS